MEPHPNDSQIDLAGSSSPVSSWLPDGPADARNSDQAETHRSGGNNTPLLPRPKSRSPPAHPEKPFPHSNLRAVPLTIDTKSDRGSPDLYAPLETRDVDPRYG